MTVCHTLQLDSANWPASPQLAAQFSNWSSWRKATMTQRWDCLKNRKYVVSAIPLSVSWSHGCYIGILVLRDCVQAWQTRRPLKYFRTIGQSSIIQTMSQKAQVSWSHCCRMTSRTHYNLDSWKLSWNTYHYYAPANCWTRCELQLWQSLVVLGTWAAVAPYVAAVSICGLVIAKNKGQCSYWMLIATATAEASFASAMATIWECPGSKS